MEEILAQIPIPEDSFWYLLATVMSFLLYRMINMHMKKIDDMLYELKEAVHQLALRDVSHDEQIKRLADEVDELKTR